MKLGFAFVLCAALSIGCTSVRTGPLRPAAAPVPPSQEIEILDAGQSATAMPEIVTHLGEDGVQRVDIPPAVLVHRFYPSGDRNFQGPMLPGGPTVISVNHPKTLEREYVMVTMPPGAPRVFYSGQSIVYDYGPQSVTLAFGPLGKPRVEYTQGIHAVEKAKAAATKVKERTGELAETAGVPAGLRYVRTQSKALVDRGAQAIGGLRRAPTE